MKKVSNFSAFVQCINDDRRPPTKLSRDTRHQGRKTHGILECCITFTRLPHQFINDLTSFGLNSTVSIPVQQLTEHGAHDLSRIRGLFLSKVAVKKCMRFIHKCLFQVFDDRSTRAQFNIDMRPDRCAHTNTVFPAPAVIGDMNEW